MSKIVPQRAFAIRANETIADGALHTEGGAMSDAADRRVKSRSLAMQVARKLLLWACIQTIVITTIGYWFVLKMEEQKTLVYLNGYLSERIRADSQQFNASSNDIAEMKRRFISLYRSDRGSEREFANYFEPEADGTIRLKKKYFRGVTDANGMKRRGMSGFIGRRHAAITDDARRRLVISYKLVAELGPAWNGLFQNLYVVVPENGFVMYWPAVSWGLSADPSLYLPTDPIYAESVPSRNPARAPVWSPLYFDPVARKWNVTYIVPVDLDGRHLLNLNQDIVVDGLLARLANDHPAGAYNVIIAKNGDLIAHPDRMNEAERRHTNLNQARDPVLAALYATIKRDARDGLPPGTVRTIKDERTGLYACYGEIAGPGWWFVTVYPRSLVVQSARQAARGLLILGIASFVLMTLVVASILRKRVARPIRQMRVASEHVSAGDYEAVAEGAVRLPEEQDNEIGLLAHSFRDMARRVGDNKRHLERTVLDRTRELKAANDALERLSFSDGLTDAFNRRAFDRDLAKAIEQSARPGETVCLLLCDIDYFKRFNDAYGHLEGDRALCIVAREMARRCPNAIYRYGGEELAALLSGADFTACRELAEAIVKGVASLAVAHRESPHKVLTISAGLLPLSEGATAAEIIKATDALLYKAKQQGRNRLAYRARPAARKTRSA